MSASQTIEQQLWESPKNWLKTLTESENVHGMVLHGEAGIGKTYNVHKILTELGKKEGKDFVVRENKGTPLGLYIFLYENADKTIVLDDMMQFWNDEIVRGILMSALWEKGDGKRYISWMTSKLIQNGKGEEAEEVPTRFEFTGKIIFINNQLPEGEEFEPFLSRCIVVEAALPYDKKVIYLKHIAQERGIDKAVIEYIFQNVDDTFENFNMRTIIKVAEIAKTCPKAWKEAAKDLLVCNKEMKLFKELITSKLPVEKQAKKFWEKTGKSRPTFYRMKKQYGERWLK